MPFVGQEEPSICPSQRFNLYAVSCDLCRGMRLDGHLFLVVVRYRIVSAPSMLSIRIPDRDGLRVEESHNRVRRIRRLLRRQSAVEPLLCFARAPIR